MQDMQASDIETYLVQLGQELTLMGVTKPMRVLMVGGAFMLLLAHMQRTTKDIDIFWLEEGEDLDQAIYAIRAGVEAVAEKYPQKLESDWLNYMTHLLMFDLVAVPKGRLWKRFGPLHVHVPAKEYILALKIVAGREKDIDDSKVLLKQVKIKTLEQAQQLLDRYIPPATQAINMDGITRSFKELFQKP